MTKQRWSQDGETVQRLCSGTLRGTGVEIPLGRDIYQCSSHIYGAVYGSQTPLAKALTLVIPQKKLGEEGVAATGRCCYEPHADKD